MTKHLILRDDGASSWSGESKGGATTGYPVLDRLTTDDSTLPSPATATTRPPEVPPWVLAHVLGDPESWAREDERARGAGRLFVRDLRGEAFDLVSVRIRRALALGARAFERAVTRAYLCLAARLDGRDARHPIRLWNFIPGILAPLADLPHRYMVFNAGRLEGYRRWLCSGAGFWKAIPTATGVGHAGEDFVVHGLAAAQAGKPVENPRQRPAYRYSERYGPRPPCFARATRIEESPAGRPWLLVGGTASVLGEETAHGDSLERQVVETLRNLEALVTAGEPTTSPDVPSLRRFRQLRVYYPRPGDGATLGRRLAGHFPAVETIELHQAELCRPDLRVEIEGLVE